MLGMSLRCQWHVRFMLILLHIKAHHQGQQALKTIRPMMKVGQTRPYGSSQLAMIEQWGSQAAGNNWVIHYPLVYSKQVYYTAAIDSSAKDTSKQYAAIAGSDAGLNRFKLITSSGNDIGISWMSIGV